MKDFISKLKINKVKFYLNLLLIMLLTGVNIYFVYSLLLLTGIETFLRTIIIIIVILIWLFFFWLSFRTLIKYKKVKYYFFLFFVLLSFIITFFLAFNINKIYSKLRNISHEYSHYSTSLVTREDNPLTSINKIGKAKIGLLNDENSIDGYQIPKEIIEKKALSNEIVYYDNYVILIEALGKKEVDYIFVPTNYKIMFEEIETIQDLLNSTKIIYTEQRQIPRQVIKRRNVINKPFTLLLMGVDSVAEDINSGSFNGDALIVITFNPKTLKTTIVSIPRDTYVPIACFNRQRKNKITHAAWYGEKCMINTIENFLGVDIDYYFKINFKGVVKLVDALGGIEVDVPYSFCEQDSNRMWGKNTVFVEKGLHLLNGEQALALSRNRKTSNYCSSHYNKGTRNDFVRGQNQQLVIKGIFNKAKGIRDINKIYKLLDTISLNMSTNMEISEILSFYNIGKDIMEKSHHLGMNEILDFQRLFISGYSRTIMDYSAFDNQGMRLNLYNFIPYNGSLKDIVEAMEINLEKRPKKVIKKLQFDINEPYQEKIIGKGYYNEAGLALLPNFVGKQEVDVVEYARKNNFKLNINYITSSDKNHKVGQIIKQKPYAKMDISYVKDITVDIVKTLKITEEEKPFPNCSLEENKEHSLCLLPDFISKDYSYFQAWEKKHSLSIEIIEEPVIEGHPDYDEHNIGKIIYQSAEPGTSLYDLINNSLTIRYIVFIDEEELIEDDDNEEDNEDDNPNIEDLIPSED